MNECGGWFWPENSTLKTINANFTWMEFGWEPWNFQRFAVIRYIFKLPYVNLQNYWSMEFLFTKHCEFIWLASIPSRYILVFLSSPQIWSLSPFEICLSVHPLSLSCRGVKKFDNCPEVWIKLAPSPSTIGLTVADTSLTPQNFSKLIKFTFLRFAGLSLPP